jgi:hypothetical protein
MFRSLRYSTKIMREGENGSGTATPGGNSQSQQQQQVKTQNNTSDFTKLWHNETSEVPPAKNTPDNSQQNAQRTPQEIFREHVSGLGLGRGADLKGAFEAAQNGDFSKFEAVMQGISEGIYTAAITNANTIFNSKLSKAVDEAVSKATGNVKASGAVSKMNEQLPFTKNPALAPVANAVLGQLLKKGADVSDAVEQVGKFFKEMHNISAKDLGLNSPRGRPSGGFNNQMSDFASSDDEEFDWMEALTGNPSS